MNGQLVLSILGVCASLAGTAGGYYAWRALDERAVSVSQERFRATRTSLRARAGVLSDLAADLHISARPSLRRIGGTSMLIEDRLEPATPLPLASVRIDWDASDPPEYPELRSLARRTLPRQTRWRRFASYAAALESLMKPALFENRPSFRVVDADWRSAGGPRLVLGRGDYFDLIDQADPLVHELLAATHRSTSSRPSWRKLPMRAQLKADPFSFADRVALVSVGTLTIRRTPDGEGTFFLIHRGVGQVAVSEGTYGVVPGGMFQPASISPLGYRRDLSIWRNIMREYNEEMLGAPEAKGENGIEVDYTASPYCDFEKALATGSLRLWSFGMGLGARDLIPCLLTAAVFEADVFDALFASIVDVNDEGTLVGGPRNTGILGLPLRDVDVDELLRSPTLDPPAAALLHLATQHRDLLLAASVSEEPEPTGT